MIDFFSKKKKKVDWFFAKSTIEKKEKKKNIMRPKNKLLYQSSKKEKPLYARPKTHVWPTNSRKKRSKKLTYNLILNVQLAKRP